MEVYKNLPEGTLAELIDNVIYMSPPPVKIHQQMLQTIFRRLSEAIEDSNLGEIIVAPFDVYLDRSSNAVQPDITVILKGNKGESRPNGHFCGIPDFIIEVISPGNKDHDLVRKKELYERFGVPEYWIVDPQTKDTLGYYLVDQQYVGLNAEQGKISFRLNNLTISFWFWALD